MRHYRGPRGPLGRYLQASLRRRLFAWFALAIIMTALGTSFAWGVLGNADRSAGQLERAKAWLGGQFASRWSDPPALSAFARDTAEGLSVELRGVDAKGGERFVVGRRCERGIVVPVVSEGARLGEVHLCSHHQGRWRTAAVLVVLLGCLYLAAAKIARRLSRPLVELTQVVERIGQGELGARTELACRMPGEVGVVAEAVAVMASRIERQLADQRELLATVSHELRTPLARLRIISELVREGVAEPKTLDDLDREVTEMDSLVGQLLAHSRLEFGTLTRRRLSIANLTQRAVERQGGSVPVRSTVTDDVLFGDATLLLRALANLLDNAAAHAGGAEALEVSLENGSVRFAVVDRGPGLRASAEDLFEKFKKSEGGLGLGLALVRRIAKAHGGDAFALTRQGGGAEVGFAVPRRVKGDGE